VGRIGSGVRVSANFQKKPPIDPGSNDPVGRYNIGRQADMVFTHAPLDGI